jgi:hypothetical protein
VSFPRFRGVEKEAGDILYESKGGPGDGGEGSRVPRTPLL